MIISDSDLIKYRISAYKTKTVLIQYGTPKIINDEGSLFRINELQVIPKFEIKDISLGDNWITINYKNGEKIILEIAKERD